MSRLPLATRAKRGGSPGFGKTSHRTIYGEGTVTGARGGAAARMHGLAVAPFVMAQAGRLDGGRVRPRPVFVVVSVGAFGAVLQIVHGGSFRQVRSVRVRRATAVRGRYGPAEACPVTQRERPG